jgi:hypothetical protein
MGLVSEPGTVTHECHEGPYAEFALGGPPIQQANWRASASNSDATWFASRFASRTTAKCCGLEHTAPKSKQRDQG